MSDRGSATKQPRDLERHREEWETLAALDPLWAIASAETARGNKWDIDAFFATGPPEVAPVFAVLETLGRPTGSARALDFGCGVGRLTRVLAERFAEACGVDISAQMIELAEKLNRDQRGCRFFVNDRADLSRFDDDSFDLVFENLVLQHLPNVQLVEGYVREFRRITRPDGVVVFQLPSSLRWQYRLGIRRRAFAALKLAGASETFLHNRLRLTPMTMLAIRESDAVGLLDRAGLDLVHVERRDDPAWPVRYLRYYAAPRPV